MWLISLRRSGQIAHQLACCDVKADAVDRMHHMVLARHQVAHRTESAAVVLEDAELLGEILNMNHRLTPHTLIPPDPHAPGSQRAAQHDHSDKRRQERHPAR